MTTIQEAANIFGLTVKQLEGYVYDGKIPTIKLGKRRYFTDLQFKAAEEYLHNKNKLNVVQGVKTEQQELTLEPPVHAEPTQETFWGAFARIANSPNPERKKNSITLWMAITYAVIGEEATSKIKQKVDGKRRSTMEAYCAYEDLYPATAEQMESELRGERGNQLRDLGWIIDEVEPNTWKIVPPSATLLPGQQVIDMYEIAIKPEVYSFLEEIGLPPSYALEDYVAQLKKMLDRINKVKS